NVAAAFVANANGPGTGTVHSVDVTLPPAVEGQSQVELRIMTSNAVGNDAFIGVDNIHVSAAQTNPGAFQFDAASSSVDERAGTATLPGGRLGGSAGAATVDYATSDGTATAPDDYTATSGTLAFAAGETSKSFTIPIVDDSLAEPTETVNLALANPTGGATLGS